MKRWSVPWRSFWFFSKQIIVFVTKYEACFGDSCLARKEEEKVVDCCWANPPFFVWNYVCCLCIHKNLPHTTCKWIRTRKYEKIHTYMLIVAVFLHTTVYKKGIWKRKKKLKKISNCAINNSVIWQLVLLSIFFVASCMNRTEEEKNKRPFTGVILLSVRRYLIDANSCWQSIWTSLVLLCKLLLWRCENNR